MQFNQLNAFRTRCMWQNGSCKTLDLNSDSSKLNNCYDLKPKGNLNITTLIPSVSLTSSTRKILKYISNTPEHKIETNITADTSAPLFTLETSAKKKLVLAVDEQSVSNNLNGSLPNNVYLNDIFKMPHQDTFAFDSNALGDFNQFSNESSLAGNLNFFSF